MDLFEKAGEVQDNLRVAAFSPHSQPKRFLCLAMRSAGRIAIHSIETFGTNIVPYDPFRVKERLLMLEKRGFLVITDSEHEIWENFPTIKMNLRSHGPITNRDYALDLLVEYKQGGLIQFPAEFSNVVPSPLEYRRVGNTQNSEYMFRQYKPTLHVTLLAILGLIHPPMISQTFVDSYFGAGLLEGVQENSLKTFQKITVGVDQQRAKELDEKYWGE